MQSCRHESQHIDTSTHQHNTTIYTHITTHYSSLAVPGNDRLKPHSLTAMAPLIFLLSISAIPLFPILGLHLVRFLLRSVGKHLRRKTNARRDLILERVVLDEELSAPPSAPTKTEDEDWEQVESYALGTAVNGDVHQDKDYAGIIGFFHPFW
jgi:hypothetical protein